MSKLTILVVALIVGFPVFNFEWNRYHELYSHCKIDWVQNEKILEDLCQNPIKRIEYGGKFNGLCTKTERENRSSPKTRAFQQWWRSSEYVSLYTRILGNTWILMGMVLFTIVVVLYFITQYLINESRERRYFGAMKDFVHRLTVPPPWTNFQKEKEKEKVQRNSLEYREHRYAQKYQYHA